MHINERDIYIYLRVRLFFEVVNASWVAKDAHETARNAWGPQPDGSTAPKR